MIPSFNVVRRNYGHWDISDKSGRLYRVRGGPGKYVVIDEHTEADNVEFKTLSACMVHICDILMFELIVAEGQEPAVIESWNV